MMVRCRQRGRGAVVSRTEPLRLRTSWKLDVFHPLPETYALSGFVSSEGRRSAVKTLRVECSAPDRDRVSSQKEPNILLSYMSPTKSRKLLRHSSLVLLRNHLLSRRRVGATAQAPIRTNDVRPSARNPYRLEEERESVHGGVEQHRNETHEPNGRTCQSLVRADRQGGQTYRLPRSPRRVTVSQISVLTTSGALSDLNGPTSR